MTFGVIQRICLILLLSAVAARSATARQIEPWPREPESPQASKPKEIPRAWRALIGEYGSERDPFYVLERSGRLWIVQGRGNPQPVADTSSKVFLLDSKGRVTSVRIGSATYDRRQVGPVDGSGQLRVEPLRPVSAVLKEAMAAEPPKESGELRHAELVELIKLDPTIRLDIRYASTNNFLGSVFYAEPRACLERQAAEALVRANAQLKKYGYGLLVHDGYRPWYVTKTFWDATPDDKKWLVADPSRGSRHNRGSAIDLTLYELKTRRAVEMPSTYDETTTRAYAFYPGGTDLQRWHRGLLRRVMESEGFTVNMQEWWHFDYKDWQRFAIGNLPFAGIRAAMQQFK